MKIIDLSATIYNEMEVFPGDPEVKVERVHNYDEQGWELRKLILGTHTGTHVDAFSHMVPRGKNLDQISLDNFLGPAMVVSLEDEFPKKTGLFFTQTINLNLLDKLLKAQPPFVGGDISEDLERSLLKHEIITYTNLKNLNRIPLQTIFFFIGLPLKIQEGDGSPVRAIAILEKDTNLN